VNNIDDFLGIVRDQLGLQVTGDDASRGLEEIPGWDSVHLLWLLTALERETGHPVSMPELLEASSLEQIYLAAVGG
jgi:acyl carrier protein